jgi:antitoxin CptB
MGERDRIRWHCRRGMLELDIVLTRFLERHFDNLSQGELKAFTELLDYPDNDLWDVVSGQFQPSNIATDMHRVIGLLRQS